MDPTKQGDESESERPTAIVVEETQQQHHDDAFSHYSKNELLRMKRMKAILLSHQLYTQTAVMMPTNKRSKPANGSSDTNAKQKTLLVPTVNTKKDTEVLGLHSTTEQDLELLQKKGKQGCCCSHLVIPHNSDDSFSQS
jgi:hypothetical protein